MEFLLTSGLYCLGMLTINHCWPLAVWCWWKCWYRRWCWNWVNANVAVDADMHGNVGVEVAVDYVLLLTINYHWLLTIVDFQHARQYRQQDHYQGLPKPPWILIMGIVPRRILNIFAKDFVLERNKEFCRALFANYFSFFQILNGLLPNLLMIYLPKANYILIGKLTRATSERTLHWIGKLSKQSLLRHNFWRPVPEIIVFQN